METLNGSTLSTSRITTVNQDAWPKLISEWQSSGESQKEFCKRLNLNLNTFTYIKGKLSIKKQKNTFIPLTIGKEISSKPIPNIILENAAGMKLHVSLTATDENIIRLLKIAGW